MPRNKMYQSIYSCRNLLDSRRRTLGSFRLVTEVSFDVTFWYGLVLTGLAPCSNGVVDDDDDDNGNGNDNGASFSFPSASRVLE